MKKFFSNGYLLPLFVMFIFTATSCKKSETAAVIPADVQLLKHPTLGTYLATSQGKTLYLFANDAEGLSSCGGTCESNWPAYTTADLAALTTTAELNKSDFATITTTTGKKQLTYKGWPLYTYSPSSVDGSGNTIYTPEAANTITGEGRGNVWFIAKPDYTIMLSNHQLVGNDGNNYTSNYTIGTGKTNHFVDAVGRSIYIFVVDSFNINKYTKPDFSNNATWPLYAEDKITVPSILDKTLFGSITVFGRKQMTYKGWPLYYFGGDGTTRGASKGVSVPVAGKWPVAVKDLTTAKKP